MKRLSPFLLPLLLLAISGVRPLQAQKLGVEDITPVYDLVKTFKHLIPFHDTSAHLTLTHVFMSTDYRYIKLTVFYDADQEPDSITPYHTLDYLIHNNRWSLQPLADHTFDLRLNISFRERPVTKVYSFTSLDIQEILNPPAKAVLAQVAQQITKRLPIPLSDSGETMVRCHYDPAANLFTNVYHYPDSTWPSIKTFIADSTQKVRVISAFNILNDTSSRLADAVLESEVTLSYHYCNQSHTDSMVVNIAPWMWETIIADLYADNEDPITDTMALLHTIAAQVENSCPQLVDSLTTLLSCRLDSVNRVMTYTYRVDELAMLSIENSVEIQNNLVKEIERSLIADPGRSLLVLLAAARVTLVYIYTSPHGGSPLTITFSPSQMDGILAH